MKVKCKNESKREMKVRVKYKIKVENLNYMKANVKIQN